MEEGDGIYLIGSSVNENTWAGCISMKRLRVALLASGLCCLILKLGGYTPYRSHCSVATIYSINDMNHVSRKISPSCSNDHHKHFLAVDGVGSAQFISCLNINLPSPKGSSYYFSLFQLT